MKQVEILEVIKTTIVTRGNDTEEQPLRTITQYWSVDGELIFEIDPKYCINHCSGDAHCSDCPDTKNLRSQSK